MATASGRPLRASRAADSNVTSRKCRRIRWQRNTVRSVSSSFARSGLTPLFTLNSYVSMVDKSTAPDHRLSFRKTTAAFSIVEYAVNDSEVLPFRIRLACSSSA